MEEATELETSELNQVKRVFLESESKLNGKRNQLASAKANLKNELEK
jgi:hypothetical protein